MLQVEHSAILVSFIKVPIVIKIFVFSIFECPFYTGYNENYKTILSIEQIFCDTLFEMLGKGMTGQKYPVFMEK